MTHRAYLKKRRLRKKQQEYQKRFQQIAGVDQKIYLYKWYPWSYKNYIPTLVLQGWYDVNRAKRFFLNKYGPDALKYVKFSKGKAILESQDFKVGKTLYINGMWRVVNSKTYIPPEDKPRAQGHSWNTLKIKHSIMANQKKRTRGHNDRVKFDYDIIYYQHERVPIRQNTKKENTKLQKVQQTRQQRKKTLFEEPS